MQQCVCFTKFLDSYLQLRTHEHDGHKHLVTVAVSQNMSLLTHTNPESFPLKKSIFVFTAIKPVTFLCHWLHLWKWNEIDISNKRNSTSK